MGLSNDSLFSEKQVPGAVQTELNARASKTWNIMHGQAKTWMHMMSMAEGAPWPISTFGNYYEVYDQNNRPRKIVESIKVSAKGEYGTTRSATIGLVFFSDDELNYFADAYLIPDMSVRVQWGWSVGAASEPQVQPLTEQIYDNDAIKRMEEIAAQYPNYEGFQGRVVSWDITLKPDINAWNVTLELVGAANSVSETPVSATSENCKCEKKVTGQTPDGENKETTVVEESSALYSALLELYDDAQYLGTIQGMSNGYSGEWAAETIAYPGFSRDEEGKEDSDGFLWIDADLDAEETYVSWGTVETLFSLFSGQQQSKDGPASFRVDSRGLTLKVPTQEKGRWFSSDPRVCILPGGGLVFQEPTEWTDYAAGIVGGALAITTFGASALIAGSIMASDEAGYGKSTANCFQDDGHIRLTDIRVSTIHLMKRVKEFESNKDTIMTAFKTLLSDINKACGSPWEFEIIDVSSQAGVDTKGSVQLAIIDANAPEIKQEPFEFKATPGNGGFCRDIKLELKMTDAMKTQALYGANGSTDVPTSGNTPCSSRFMQYTRNSKVNLGKVKSPNEASDMARQLCQDVTRCNESNEDKHPVDKLSESVVGVNIDGARVYLESQKRKGELQALEQGGISTYCATAALPMNFSATLTGIGGFRWGMAVTCDRIPTDLRTLVKYQVTTVEHNITPDDWTTTVNTVARKRY